MPRMVGEKSSIVPVAVGGIIIAVVAVAVWYAMRGSQTEEVPSRGNIPSAIVTPPSYPGAASDNAVSDNATSGTEADNNVSNTADGAMGAENSVGGNTAGADNAVNDAENSVAPTTGATPPSSTQPMTGGNTLPVPPPAIN